MSEPVESLLPIVATFVLAGLIKGVVGLGLPTVAMGLLGLFMPPAKAASLLLIPAFVTNIWQLLAGSGLRPLLRRLGSLLAGVAIGTLAGAGLIAGAAGPAATAGLGAALMIYAGIGLSRFAFNVRPGAERWAGPVVGLTTGLITGATGTFAIPAVPYLSALRLERDDLVQALGLSFTVSTVAMGAGLAWHGALRGDLAVASVAALVPALAGMWLGSVVRRLVSASVFRRIFFVGLLALGAELLWRGLA